MKRWMLAGVVLAASCLLPAQPRSGSISTRPFPVTLTTIFDPAGNTYLVGGTGPVTPGAAQTQSNNDTCVGGGGFIPSVQPCGDAYIAKYDAAGSIVFGTLLGGPKADGVSAIELAADGSVFFTGQTGGFLPVTANAANSTYSKSGYAAKLSADGSKFLYVTYLPADFAQPAAIAVDPRGNVYVTGRTTADHAFIAALNANGSAFIYSAQLVGSQQDRATAIAVDADGNAVVSGYTASLDFPVTGDGVQTPSNGFLARFDPSGKVLFATYFAGIANTMKVDSAGDVYVAGTTIYTNLPTTPSTFQPEALVPMWNGSPGGFLTKLAPDARKIVYSTYVPSVDHGSLFEGVTSIALDSAGGVYLAGSAGAAFPVTDDAPQYCFGGRTDAFVAHLDDRGALTNATYVGGPRDDSVYGLALAGNGDVRLAWFGGISIIRFGDPSVKPTACISQDVVNSATLYSRGLISPGEFVSLTGFGIGPDVGAGYQANVRGAVSTELAGVRVFFDGQPAPVTYAQSRIVNLLVPFELAGKTSTNITLEYNGGTFGPITVPVSFGEPGIFRLSPGQSDQALAINEDGTVNGPTNPAAPGSIMTIWGTGFGPTAQSCATGELNAPVAVNLAPGNSVALFDGNTTDLVVQYAGSAPTLLCGIVQINFQVQANARSGSLFFQPWAVQTSGKSISSTQASVGVTISIK